MIYLLVGAAGMIGALLRYYVGLIFDSGWAWGFPLGTFLANMAGSFVLAWFTTYISAMKKIHPHVLTAVGTGLVGSFTTFSTFSVETVQLLRQGDWQVAFIYVLLSLIGGLFLSGLGYYTGKSLHRKWREETA
ncbi:MAG TPA: fluoride efflux transporter CrcB [Bacillales bacterium]